MRRLFLLLLFVPALAWADSNGSGSAPAPPALQTVAPDSTQTAAHQPPLEGKAAAQKERGKRRWFFEYLPFALAIVLFIFLTVLVIVALSKADDGPK